MPRRVYVRRQLLRVVVGAALLSAGAAEADQSQEIIVSAEHQRCAQDRDCGVVSTHCGGCSCGAAVSQSEALVYHQLFQQRCAAYRGPVCDFYCPTPFALCQSGQCALSASDPSVFETVLPALIGEAELIAEVEIRAIDTSAMPADGPMIVDADIVALLKGAALGKGVHFAASAWVGPTYRPGERRLVFLKRFPDADIARRKTSWMSLEAGRLDALVIGPLPERVEGTSLAAFFRGSSVALRLPSVRKEKPGPS